MTTSFLCIIFKGLSVNLPTKWCCQVACLDPDFKLPGQTKIPEVSEHISANKLWACQTKSLQQTKCCVVKVTQWVWDVGSNHQQVLYVTTWSLGMLEIHLACHLNMDVEVFFRLLQKTASSHLTKNHNDFRIWEICCFFFLLEGKAGWAPTDCL